MNRARQTCQHGKPLLQACAACIEAAKARIDLAAVEQAGYQRAERDIIAELLRCDAIPEWAAAAAWIKGGHHRPKPRDMKRDQ